MNSPVILYDILKAVGSKIQIKVGGNTVRPKILIGRDYNIMSMLSQIDRSVTEKATKFPFIGFRLPVSERHGSGYYAKVTIPKILICDITKSEDWIEDRFSENGAFKKTLYPLYYDLLKNLSFSTSIISTGEDNFTHVKIDQPSAQPISTEFDDYVDCIEIQNLEIILSQQKTC